MVFLFWLVILGNISGDWKSEIEMEGKFNRGGVVKLIFIGGN